MSRARSRLLPLLAALGLVASLGATGVVGAATAATAGTTAATASNGWRWTSHSADVATGLACPSTTLCIGVDGTKIAWSTNPTAAKATFAKAALEPATSRGGTVTLSAVACADVHFCAITDDVGNVFTSTSPAGGKKAWTKTDSGAGTSLTAIACASSTLCEALDYNGAALISTNPLAATPTWTKTTLDTSSGAFPVGASCVGTTVCAAVFDDAKIYYTLNASSMPATWHHVSVKGRGWDGIACPTTSRCIAVGTLSYASRVAVTNNLAGGAKTWTAATINNPATSAAGTGLAAVSCATKAVCFALGDMFSRTSAAKASAWHGHDSCRRPVQDRRVLSEHSLVLRGNGQQ